MSYRKYPINFYQEDNKITYENGFIKGEAKSLLDALNKIQQLDLERDLYYYFDDIHDVIIGKFIPVITNRKKKGKKLIGQLEVKLDVDSNNTDPSKSISYLSKDDKARDDHLKWINKMKRQEKINNITDKIKHGIDKVINKLFNKRLFEMFDPKKTYKQLICEHCGRVIPIGTYYDDYDNKHYHIECLWDKIINEEENNSYESAERFFFSLKDMIGNWPAYGYDVEEDYISDLELVNHNNRIIHRTPMEESLLSINETLEYYLRDNNEKTI